MDALRVQLEHYDYLRSNVEFCAAAAANKIVNGWAVYSSYQDTVYEMNLAFSIPLSANDTEDYEARIGKYLAFCEQWTSEHISR